MNFIKNLLCIVVIFGGCLSRAIEHMEVITLVASDCAEFKINKNLIAKVSPLIKDFLQPELQKTGIEQARFELTSMKPVIIESIVQAVPLIAPLEKVICKDKENELRFYPFKEIKNALEPWWQSVTHNLTSSPLAPVRLFQQRLKGELLRAAHYLEIKPLEKYIAYKIAQELHNKKEKEINELMLRKAGFGVFVESSFKLVKRYFTLLSIHAEEYTIADYILAEGQPKKIDKDTNLSFLNAGLTSLYGISCIEGVQKITLLELTGNNLIEIARDELRYLPNLEFIYLAYNSISSIETGSFVGLTNLKYLDLSRNKILTIDNDTFKGLNNLSTLYLSGNSLTSLKDKVFDGLVNLKELFLQYNQLNSLGDKIFAVFQNLKVLSLSNNKLGMLPASLFDLKNCVIFANQNPLSLITQAKIVYYKNRYNMDIIF